MDKETAENKVSPFGKMNVQISYMTTNTGISLHRLKKEFTYMIFLQPTKRSPGSRTAEQEHLSREVMVGVIEGCDAETAVVLQTAHVVETLDLVVQGHVCLFLNQVNYSCWGR